MTDELVKRLRDQSIPGGMGLRSEAAALLASQAAEITSVKEQLREALVEIMRRDDEDVPKIASQAARIERLEDALLTYGVHQRDCHSTRGGNCTCEIGEALAPADQGGA